MGPPLRQHCMSILSSEVCKHHFQLQEVPPRPSISQPHAETLTTTDEVVGGLAAATGTYSQLLMQVLNHILKVN